MRIPYLRLWANDALWPLHLVPCSLAETLTDLGFIVEPEGFCSVNHHMGYHMGYHVGSRSWGSIMWTGLVAEGVAEGSITVVMLPTTPLCKVSLA